MMANDKVPEELDILRWVLAQACGDREVTGMYDSMALSAYADGLRLLAKHGLVEITHEVGRRVIARDVPEALVLTEAEREKIARAIEAKKMGNNSFSSGGRHE